MKTRYAFFAILCIAFEILTANVLHAQDDFKFKVGSEEIVASKDKRYAIGLQWFVDGNLGAKKTGKRFVLYGPNGKRPVRITGTLSDPFQKVESVKIVAIDDTFQYLSGGPIYTDLESGKSLLFYHAEIHRGDAKNPYCMLGLAIQTDKDGLVFKDIGPIYRPNIPEEKAKSGVEVGGSPFVAKDGYFYVYARDVSLWGGQVLQRNLCVARADIKEVVQNAMEGKNTEWLKYFEGSFSEPGIGGKSTALEDGNPITNWMDVSYNTFLNKFILVVAARTTPEKVELFLSSSDDGIHWSPRQTLAKGQGELFYTSLVGLGENPRESEREFYVYYVSSIKGGWGRWADAVIARRKITLDK